MVLAGIALVALLLAPNVIFTVEKLNGLIFYATVVYVNKSILLPFQKINFTIVFISWLNLEVGTDTCYFPGMDTYLKTWLQLVFHVSCDLNYHHQFLLYPNFLTLSERRIQWQLWLH